MRVHEQARTPEAVGALPPNSVLIDGDGTPWMCLHCYAGGDGVFASAGRRLWSDQIPLPAEVIWKPEVKK